MGYLVNCEYLNCMGNTYQMDKRQLERQDSKLLYQAWQSGGGGGAIGYKDKYKEPCLFTLIS